MPLPPPTRLEQWLRVRIDLKLFGTFLGTGHLDAGNDRNDQRVTVYNEATDNDSSSDSEQEYQQWI